MRIGPGEMKKIIDDAIERKDRHPLEEYILLLIQLDKLYPQESSRKRARFGDIEPN